ncbi:MAG: YdcF family protein [Alphaproteobacteria bacterium]|nr:YdcF family protein [Alphaproteobacteria bacterium]
MKEKKIGIVVLSAGVKKDKKGNWVSTGFDIEDFDLGAPGGILRVLATSYLCKEDFKCKIIASGGRGWDVKNDELTRPDLSTILKNELIKLGISDNNIIEESRSNKTFEQLIEIDKMISKMNFDKMFVITNDYHVKRVSAIINYLKQINNKDKMKVVSAEEICIKYDSKKWKSMIEKAYVTSGMKEIIKMEENGQKDIKKGKYNFN